jgi:hypothetical protein
MTTETRNKLPSSAFALPESRDFPIGDLKHARLAIGGATRSFNAGNITAAQKEQIQAKARRKLGEGRYKSHLEP